MASNFTVENIVILLFFGGLILSSVCLCYKRYIYEASAQVARDEIIEVHASPYTEVTIENPNDSDTILARPDSFKIGDDSDFIPKATEAFQLTRIVAQSVTFYEESIPTS